MEDFNGVSLKKLLNKFSLNTATFWKIAPKIARSLGNLHAKNIILQDLLIFRPRTNEVHHVETNGLWLGFDFDLGRVNMDEELVMESGDVLLLYTDGITESRNEKDEMYGEKRLVWALLESGKKTTGEIKDEIIASLKGFRNNDDITLMLIKRA